MRIPSARNLLIARVVSTAGSWVQVAAASWYVLSRTGSASAVGLLAALSFAPGVFGSPVGGWLTDRFNVRRLAFLLSLCQAVSPLIIAFLIWDGEMAIPLLYVLVFLGAIPSALAGPVISVLLPQSVPIEMRAVMIANSAVCYNIGRVFGPLIGSALVIWVSVAGAFLVNALSYGFNAFVISFAVLVSTDRKQSRPDRTSFVSGVREGWGYGAARVAVLSTLVFFGLVAPIQQMMSNVARLHSSSIVHVGILMSSLALGGVIANPLIRRAFKADWTYRRLLDVGLMISGPVLVLLGFNSYLPFDIVLLAILGGAWECVWVSARTTLQLELPSYVTGRMLGLFYSAVMLGTAFGSLVMGLMFDEFGTRMALLAIGVSVAVYGVVSDIRFDRGYGKRTPEQASED